ncbi:MAG: HEAT repeat domain-containing protein, partial [Gammaproteobacteria bacterium]|nr:HEAT repeat domain-containing protein [Gammaproteobacteria bacterium]
IGQSRAAEMRTLLRRLMFNDANPEIRQHTAFAWSQSKLPDVAPELVEQGRKDPDSGVRGQAWFWLAQTGSASAEDAITRAIDNESEPEVREQAIFALSQLPAQRGVDALIGLLQDRSLPRNHRKQAMFWLAQSESSDAMEYLGDILSR